jgi:uncharacterized protein (TIGR02996 family)
MTEAPFLQAVIDQPDEDGPRLVYADWLDEQGESARAEFIRVQCELFQLPTDNPRRKELAAREKRLLKRHGREWTRPPLPHDHSLLFRRGFPHLVQATSAQFLSSGPAWFAAAPTLEALSLLDAGGQVAAFAASPLLGRLRWLSFQFSVESGSFDPGGMSPVAATRVDNYLTPADLAALAACAFQSRFWGLSLSHTRLGAGGLGPLLDAPWLNHLTQLDLSGNGLGDSATVALANCPRLCNLLDLGLSGNRIGADGAAALARSPHLTSLAMLNLSRNRIGGTLLQSLGRLWQGSAYVTPGVQALVDALAARRQVLLDLHGNRLTRGDTALLTAAFGPRVRL